MSNTTRITEQSSVTSSTNSPIIGELNQNKVEHWSHTPLIVVIGVFIGFVITAVIYGALLRPFLVGNLPTYPFWFAMLTFVGTLLLVLCLTGKTVQRIRKKSHYYEGSTFVANSIDS